MYIYTCTSFISQKGIPCELFFRLLSGSLHNVLLVSPFSQYSTLLVHTYIDSLHPWTVPVTIKSDILFDQTPIGETPKTFQKIKHNNTKLALSFNTKLGIRSSLFILLCSHQNRER